MNLKWRKTKNKSNIIAFSVERTSIIFLPLGESLLVMVLTNRMWSRRKTFLFVFLKRKKNLFEKEEKMTIIFKIKIQNSFSFLCNLLHVHHLTRKKEKEKKKKKKRGSAQNYLKVIKVTKLSKVIKVICNLFFSRLL